MLSSIFTSTPLVFATTLLSATAEAAVLPQVPLGATAAAASSSHNPSSSSSTTNLFQGFHFPTVHESTILARRMLHLEGSGYIATVFPSSDANLASPIHTRENRPPRVAHLPFTLPEYIADCEPTTGNPTILQVDIANTFRNAAAGSNVTLSISWHPPGKLEDEYSAAMMPRFALLGWLQEMELSDEEEKAIRTCYLKRHPDTIWAPGSDIHTSRWTRLVVEEFYWFGGFGDRARIQWIDPDEWRGVTMKEIEAARLPGEQ